MDINIQNLDGNVGRILVEIERKKILYNAASNGDLFTFQQLLQEDPSLLDEAAIAGFNPLHIALIRGHETIVDAVLSINPQYARKLNSENSSALHVAAECGHLEITSKLLKKASEMLWQRDIQGMNPVHVAAVNGQVEVLDKLIEYDIGPAMETVHRGRTILHLCVAHRQYDALVSLATRLGGEFVTLKDDDGETILHLAARFNQAEMIRFLSQRYHIPKFSKNNMGKLAWDLATAVPPDTRRLLSCGRFEPYYMPDQSTKEFVSELVAMSYVLVALSLGGTIVSPGGVFQDGPLAGDYVMASRHPQKYRIYVIFIIISFLGSIATIVLAKKNRVRIGWFYLHFLTFVLSVASFLVSYAVTLLIIIPMGEIAIILVTVGVVIVGFILLVTISYFVIVRRLTHPRRFDN